jgi:hypothetical protein
MHHCLYLHNRATSLRSVCSTSRFSHLLSAAYAPHVHGRVPPTHTCTLSLLLTVETILLLLKHVCGVPQRPRTLAIAPKRAASGARGELPSPPLARRGSARRIQLPRHSLIP